MIVPVILSGGSGTRLWPLSREGYPKQFLPLIDDQTLFQDTVRRAALVPDSSAPLMVCNEQHRFLAAEQLRALNSPSLSIMLEPMGRNTAPAVACAAIKALEHDEDALLLVLPADHVIQKQEAFVAAVEQAVVQAKKGALVTFGIVATAAETGFGYIRRGQQQGDCYHVASFVEKPDAKTAQAYIDTGEYYWNSGMFVFSAKTYMQVLDHFQPAMAEACRAAVAKAVDDLDFTRLHSESFAACPADSIDYAVMEKAENVVVVPLDAAWSDVGSWSALSDASSPDAAGNVFLGDVLSHDSEGCYVRSNGRLLAMVGVKDHIVVETADAVLVAHRDRVQDVKSIVNQLNAAGRPETLLHKKVYRPWGSYEGISMGERFQVKRITVNPGGCLSLQKHHHRAEHWIVVKGTALVQFDEQQKMVTEDQSVYLPLGCVHRLENPGVIPVELIEVQTGSYLGEDDIVRLEDVYGRVPDVEEQS